MENNTERIEVTNCQKETSVEFDFVLEGPICELLEKCSINFQGPGWYRDGKDTILIVPYLGVFRMYVWLEFDPRPLFESLLELPDRISEE